MPQNSNSPQHPNEHTLHSNQDDLGPTIVCAPFAGYLTLPVGQGEHVDAGQKLAIVEALKVETLVTARTHGRVGRITHTDGSYVTGGQLLLTIVPE